MRLSLLTLATSTIMFWLAQAAPHHNHHHHHSSDIDVGSHHNNSSTTIVPGKHFDRVVIIVFENKDYSTAMKNKYLKSLPGRHNGMLDENAHTHNAIIIKLIHWCSFYIGVLLTNYHGTSHPSQPNYIAMISGSTKGTKEDDESNFDRDTIVDLLEKKQISWKTYQEDYPGGCNSHMDIDNYARKHNPFISFKNIRNNKERCANIVNADQLDNDIKDDKVPQYVYYTPNVRYPFSQQQCSIHVYYYNSSRMMHMTLTWTTVQSGSKSSLNHVSRNLPSARTQCLW
ncbi:acid phosphatase [Lichtheimia corymbifera JMRC:FSU:9682]|uniref:Acid phosphatase n=1 Tax=Lichtheimia corymbifera JMRC:FSU:9682 TaxID=1263082 RepID=A0A068RTB9_9FUNG|nr:acid phosphatase [Lichtheimia corymbifera JMRC:FSU:9682]